VPALGDVRPDDRERYGVPPDLTARRWSRPHNPAGCSARSATRITSSGRTVTVPALSATSVSAYWTCWVARVAVGRRSADSICIRMIFEPQADPGRCCTLVDGQGESLLLVSPSHSSVPYSDTRCAASRRDRPPAGVPVDVQVRLVRVLQRAAQESLGGGPRSGRLLQRRGAIAVLLSLESLTLPGNCYQQ